MSHDHPQPPPTTVDVSALIDQPGASRPVDVALPAPEGLEVPLTRFTSDVEVTGVLESLVDGVLLRGDVAVDVSQTCARCLEPVAGTRISLDVAELFSDPAQAADPEDVEDGYAIADDQIDLDTLLRDTLVQAPSTPLCREDCAGLCPTCGRNRNAGDCDCRDESHDDRWAALADLKLNP